MPTKIEWCDEVWNPVWGCEFGCRYCYARRIAAEHGKTGSERAFKPTWKLENFQKKFAQNTRRVFVNSMSDIHFWKPDWLKCVLDRIREMPQIDFIFLTKGNSYPLGVAWPENVILGYTITGRNTADRFAPVKGVRMLFNVEPLLEPMGAMDALVAASCSWLIVGAETGDDEGKVIPHISWVDCLIASCMAENVPVFVKDNMLPHMGMDDIPDYLRQFPGHSGEIAL